MCKINPSFSVSGVKKWLVEEEGQLIGTAEEDDEDDRWFWGDREGWSSEADEPGENSGRGPCFYIKAQHAHPAHGKGRRRRVSVSWLLSI